MVNRGTAQRVPPLDPRNVQNHLEALVSMGPRWPSSPAECFASAHIEKWLRPHVDEVVSEGFDYPAYVPLEASLQILSKDGRRCGALGVQFSANGETEGEIVYARDGDSFDAARMVEPLEGRILLTRTRRPYLVARNSEGSGLAGAIIISESPINTIRSMGAKLGYVQGMDPEKYRTTLPMVAVDELSGRHLEELSAEGGVKVRLVHKSLQVRRRSRNVVARTRGKSGQRVVVGAHFDTQINVPGAWDNAAGCALLIDMARAAQGLSAVHDMEFVAFGCEELGVIGSSNYIERRRDELDRIACYFNLDSVSSSTSTVLELHTTQGMEHFAQAVLHTVCRLEPDSCTRFGPGSIAQDSAPFFLNGVEAVWLHEEGNPCFHTPLDTVEKVRIERLMDVGGAVWTMFSYLCGGGMA